MHNQNNSNNIIVVSWSAKITKHLLEYNITYQLFKFMKKHFIYY